MGVWNRTPRAWDSLAVTPAALPQALNDDLRAMALGFGAWTSYTPAWTSNGSAPALGNGSISGSYLQVQKLVIAKVVLITGTTSTYGTGIYFFSLPVAAASGLVYGSGLVTDNSPSAQYTAVAIYDSSTRFALVRDSGYVAATSPITFTTSDRIAALIGYEAS